MFYLINNKSYDNIGSGVDRTEIFRARKTAEMETQCQKFPFEIYDVEPELAKELMEHYIGAFPCLFNLSI